MTDHVDPVEPGVLTAEEQAEFLKKLPKLNANLEKRQPIKVPEIERSTDAYLGTIDEPPEDAPKRTRVDSHPRVAQDQSGAIGKDLKTFTQSTWKKFLTFIANGAKKPQLLHKMGITNASFNIYLVSVPGAAAEYENARLQWVRRDWPLELIEDICVEFIMGAKLSQICAERNLNEAAFWRVIMTDPTYQEMFNEARQIHMEREAEVMLSLADDIELDGANTTANSAKVNKARLQSENRRWLMERLHPERFGKVTKQDINMQTTVNHAEELEKARKRNQETARKRQELLDEASATIH